MTRKIPRPETDITRLAGDLAARWTPGEPINAWLRRHEPRLRRLVHSGWSWDDVARALTSADILYGSRRPWTGKLLNTKAAQVRAARRAGSGSPTHAGLVEPLSVTLHEASPSPAPVRHPLASGEQAPSSPTPDQAPERPRFALAQLVSQHEVPPKAASDPAKDAAPAPATKHDADAVMRRFLGGTGTNKE